MQDGRSIALAVVATLMVIWYFAVHRKRSRFMISNTRLVGSSVDGMQYRVFGAGDTASASADALADLNARVIDIMRVLRDQYVRAPPSPGQTATQRTAVTRLLERYNPDNIVENSPRDPDRDTAYTIDKGKVLALCIRDRAANAIYDPDLLLFVTLHEMAHIAIEDTTHSDEFWSTFRFLLEAAVAAGLYTSTDYARAPRMYCGLKVEHSPLWDPAIRSI